MSERDQKFNVPAPLEAEIDELITHYPQKRSASLMVLHLLQERFGFISKPALEWAAAKLELKPVNLFELVTFYPMFRQEPVGKHHVKICRTLSCALSGSHELFGHVCDKLGLDTRAHGPQTTKDGFFTVEFVECLASCGSGPAVMINDAFHEKVTLEKADRLLAELKGGK